MKSKRVLQNLPLLADMHTDGIRFDPRVIEALRLQNQMLTAQAVQGTQNT